MIVRYTKISNTAIKKKTHLKMKELCFLTFTRWCVIEGHQQEGL